MCGDLATSFRYHSSNLFPSNNRITWTGNSLSSFHLPREILSLETFFFPSQINEIFNGFKSLLIRVFFLLNLYIYVFENWITFKLILNLNNFDRSTFFSKSCKLTLRLNLSSFLHWSPFKVNSYFHPILNLEFHISCTVLISIFLLHSLYDSSVVPLAHRFSSFFLPFEEHEDTPLLDSISS